MKNRFFLSKVPLTRLRLVLIHSLDFFSFFLIALFFKDVTFLSNQPNKLITTAITMIKEKMTFMSMWREADPEEQSWDAVNETAESEASIVTLDPTEDFDDFSDMQLELSQWISNV